MNSKALVIGAIALGLLLAALLARNGGLLALAIPILTYLTLGVLQAPAEIRLSGARTLERPTAFAGEPVEMSLSMRNEGGGLASLYLDDTFFSSMTLIEGQASQHLALPASETVELRYVFQSSRAVLVWDSLRVQASDPLGLFEIEKDIPAPGEILVRPVTIKLRQVSIKPRFTLRTAGTIPARRAGSGSDFWGVREYRPGDALQRLNWRLNARHPRKLFTNEFEREEIGDFGMILDARMLSDDMQAEQALFESSLSAAASLAELFLRHADRVSFLVFGESMNWVFPGSGKRQLHLILRSLAQAWLGRNVPLTYLGYMPARLFPNRSTMVVFSTLGSQDMDAYSRLRATGHEVLLISADPTGSGNAGNPGPRHDLAIRAARVERAVQLKQLTRLGVNVIDWQAGQPMETIVRRAARSLSHRINLAG